MILQLHGGSLSAAARQATDFPLNGKKQLLADPLEGFPTRFLGAKGVFECPPAGGAGLAPNANPKGATKKWRGSDLN